MTVTDILIALIPAFGLGFQVIYMQLIGGKYTNKVMGIDPDCCHCGLRNNYFIDLKSKGKEVTSWVSFRAVA